MFRELTAEDHQQIRLVLQQMQMQALHLLNAAKRLEEMGLKQVAVPMKNKLGDLLYDISQLRACLRLVDDRNPEERRGTVQKGFR